MVALQPIGLPRPATDSRGTALKLIHDAFRRELALLRKEIADSGTTLGAQLRVNCLTVCQGLRQHHASEETGTFRIAVEHSPRFAGTVDRLRREHRKIAALLDELQAVLSRGGDRRPLLREVERLTVLLEGHLAYEEEHLIPVLDAPAP
ncbi:hemerythrin domain-containing protein [Streptomyces sp. NRAIS4]